MLRQPVEHLMKDRMWVFEGHCKEHWKRENHRKKLDFVKFNFDIKTETYILITNEKYKYERTASKWFLQHRVPYNALFNCFHCSVENPTGRTGSPLRFTINRKKKNHHYKHPIVWERRQRKSGSTKRQAKLKNLPEQCSRFHLSTSRGCLSHPTFQLRSLPLPLDQTDIGDMLCIIHNTQIRKLLGGDMYTTVWETPRSLGCWLEDVPAQNTQPWHPS